MRFSRVKDNAISAVASAGVMYDALILSSEQRGSQVIRQTNISRRFSQRMYAAITFLILIGRYVLRAIWSIIIAGILGIIGLTIFSAMLLVPAPPD